MLSLHVEFACHLTVFVHEIAVPIFNVKVFVTGIEILHITWRGSVKLPLLREKYSSRH